MRLLLAAAAPLCLFAAQAHAQDSLTATGSCKTSPDVEKVLADNLGATKFRGTACDTMTSTPGSNVTYTHAGAPQDRAVFAGKYDSDGDLSVTTLTLGNSAPIPVKMGFCNGGPLEGGQTAMVCSAAYDLDGVTMGITVVFIGKPKS